MKHRESILPTVTRQAVFNDLPFLHNPQLERSSFLAGVMSHSPAVEQIKHLKRSYFRTIDAKLWDEFAQLFTLDCTFVTYRDLANLDPKRRCGRDEIVASVCRTVGNAVTAHQGYLLEIEIQSPERATAVWDMTDYAEIPNGAAPPKIMRGAGRYYEDYRLVEGKWMIARLELKRSAITIE